MRAPILEPPATTLGEPEIHSRSIDALGMFEQGELDALSTAATEGLDAYKAAFFEAMASNPKIGKLLSHVLYRTLGASLPEGQAATAATWGLCQVYAMKHPAELARAGCSGDDAGTELWRKIVSSPSGAVIGESTYGESFTRIPHPDNKIQLIIRELLDELEELKKLQPLVDTSDEYPFALVAGVRRAYTANCAIRDPRWVKGKTALALTMHPEDGADFDLPEGSRVRLKTEVGETTVELAYDERNHRGQISVPNGQGMAFTDEEGNKLDGGVFVNELTSTTHRDKFIGTPFHKFVPASVTRA
jgi:formate dehydrogenase